MPLVRFHGILGMISRYALGMMSWYLGYDFKVSHRYYFNVFWVKKKFMLVTAVRKNISFNTLKGLSTFAYY